MGMIIGLIVLALIALLVVWGIGRYNQMIGTAEMVDNAMAQIAAQVESRWDALTNLISATKSYQSHEADTLKQIVHERSGVSRQSSVSQIEEDQAQFERAMRAIDVVVEQYPDLKASNVYQQTMTSVDKYENNVRQSRMVFNDMVTKFNRLIKVFPNSIIANLTGFQAKDYFKSSPEKAEMPQW
ncbi:MULTISPECIES: LemA family protein [Aerococcus]|nr:MULTISPECIES: LemA family protein [Aerococcus]MDK6368497.1 LemA family protein [Aerococcus sp. UMB9870]MDK6679580.1 LemA family protein [Aerococcus sp. UMB8608]MDK6686424.1 LemA family protein [Aerococcus sp. UMB8623]MDK6940954.1 LemA family protein [Aerococcus sp. UMB8487]